MKKTVLLLIAVFAVALGAQAQRVINGYVSDASSGEPLVGATVSAVGAKAATATDVSGQFSLNVPNNVKKLRVTFVGYSAKEVDATNGVRVALEEDNTTLDEVMVVAYGTSKKSSFTGSAEGVSNKKLELRPVTSATKALEGNVNGVQIASSNGQPGSAPTIMIRGVGSINAYTTPLYVVDGIPYDGNISTINPNDIESMTVLKDASAGALYGARGANGVVMITTKKGAEGKPSITWRSTMGWSNRATKRYDLVDQKEYAQLAYEALRNGYYFDEGYSWDAAAAAARASLGSTLGGEAYNPFKNYTWDTLINPATGQVQTDAQSAWDENWLDAVQRTGFRHEHQFSLAGGTAKTKYMMSLGYLNDEGILQTTRYQRYTGRASVDSQVNDWFKANISMNGAHSVSNYAGNNASTAYSNAWYSAQFINPLFPLYLKDLDGNNVLDENGQLQYDWNEAGQTRPGQLSDMNSLGMLELNKRNYEIDNGGVRTGFVLGGDADRLGWAKGLKLAVNFGADLTRYDYNYYYNSKHGDQAASGGLLYKYNYRYQSYTFNQLLTWNRKFGDHNFDFLVGHEYYAYKENYLEASKSNLIDGILELRPGTTIQSADSYQIDYRINSFLSRFNYDWAGRYYLSASLRQDASSRFYKDNHTGTFWSVGANWRLSEESFMKQFDWLDNASLRVSYGQQGNDNLTSYYAWQSLYNLEYANGNNIGAIISSLENKDLKWEKNNNLNIGLETSFLKNRVKFNMEYYYRKSVDMLLSYPMALSTGFSGYDANVGNMRNAGFEFTLNVVPVRTDDFMWDVTIMANTISNKVLKLTDGTPEIISGIYTIREGSTINTFRLPKAAGVDPLTGKQLYYAYERMDENDNPIGEYITDDYSVASNSRYYMGSRMPDLYGSLGTSLSYKGINLSVLTTYSIGGKVYDSLYGSSMNLSSWSSTWSKNAMRRWQQPGDVTDVARIEYNGNWTANDNYLLDASYFAIKNITLSYDLPSRLIKKSGISALKVFGSIDNLALWSHLNGMDPQYNFSGGTNYAYAANRTYQLGIELHF